MTSLSQNIVIIIMVFCLTFLNKTQIYNTKLPFVPFYLLTYLLTYSMAQSPSWEANWFAASQEIPAFHGTRRFITALTSVRHHPACECFLTWMFYREGLLAPRPTPKLEDHPLSAVRDCLFNLFAATLLIGGRSSIHNLRRRHAAVTGTHYILLWWMAQLVEALRYKPKGRGLDSQWNHWNFSLT